MGDYFSEDYSKGIASATGSWIDFINNANDFCYSWLSYCFSSLKNCAYFFYPCAFLDESFVIFSYIFPILYYSFVIFYYFFVILGYSFVVLIFFTFKRTLLCYSFMGKNYSSSLKNGSSLSVWTIIILEDAISFVLSSTLGRTTWAFILGNSF